MKLKSGLSLDVYDVQGNEFAGALALCVFVCD